MAGKMSLKNKKLAETKEKIKAILEDIKANIKDIDEVTITYDDDLEEITISYLDKEIVINYDDIDDDTLMDLDEELYALAFESTKKDLMEYLKKKNIKITGTDYDEDTVIIETEEYDDILYNVYYEDEVNTNTYNYIVSHYIFKIDKKEVDRILEEE